MLKDLRATARTPSFEHCRIICAAMRDVVGDLLSQMQSHWGGVLTLRLR